MDILCITHAEFETAGIIETWAQDAGHDFVNHRPYCGESLPTADHFDMLIIMGGPQSPLKLDEFPYLADEMKLIKEAIAAHKKVIGFCLGAQLIGEALGAKTERSPEKEIGVYPITLTDEAQHDHLLEGLPKELPVIHWHNDMPGLTSDSILLAFSAGCPRQIIRYKPLVYGFQCHLEITLPGMKDLIDHVPGDLKTSKYTQTKDELIAQDYASINHTMIEILNRFVGL